MTNQTPHNPLLARVRIPGQRYKLPSGGLFYKNGELTDDAVDGEITVMPMTMLDEIILKTPDKLLNGDGIVEVLSRCAPQILKPWNILAKDMDFIMICLRIVSYGELMEVEYTHDTCSHTVVRPGKEGETEDETIRVARQYKLNTGELVKSTRRIDPTTMDEMFKYNLPNDQIVQFKPMTFESFVQIMQASVFDTDDTADALVHEIVNTLSGVILSVDEIDDQEMIKEWLLTMSPAHLKLLNAKLSDTMQWGPEMVIKTICVDCGETMELATPLDPLSFFS